MAKAVADRRVMPVRSAEVTLDGDYAIFRVVMRTNPPMRLLSEFSSGDYDRICTALDAVVTEWDVVDDDGNLAPPLSKGGREVLPLDFPAVLLKSYLAHIQAMSAVPKG